MTPRQINYLTQTELKKLFRVIKSKRDKALFYLAYRYGLRASEVGILRRDHIDFDRLKIQITRLKGSISSEYDLQPEVKKLLSSYIRTRDDDSPILFPTRQGNPVSRHGLKYLMNRYATAAELPKDKRNFHVLKHSIATHLLESKADIMFVKQWLGHKNIQNTLIYAELINTERDERARAVFASAKIV